MPSGGLRIHRTSCLFTALTTTVVLAHHCQAKPSSQLKVVVEFKTRKNDVVFLQLKRFFHQIAFIGKVVVIERYLLAGGLCGSNFRRRVNVISRFRLANWRGNCQEDYHDLGLKCPVFVLRVERLKGSA